MANFRLAVLTRNALADALDDRVNLGAGAGTIKIYSGTQPATADTAIGVQVLLATLTFSDPAFGVAASGVITASAITQDVSADNTGTATWARVADSNGATVFDCDVAVAGATLTIDNAFIVADAPVSITSFTVTMPAS